MNPKQLYRQIKSAEGLQRRQKHPTKGRRHIIRNFINLLINAKSHGFHAYCSEYGISIKWLSYVKSEESTPSIVAHSIIEKFGYCSFQPKHPTRKKSLQLQ
jgi:hypothetical protein